jgi:Tol biopolymer transport system component
MRVLGDRGPLARVRRVLAPVAGVLALTIRVTPAGVDPNGASGDPAYSPDGRYLAFDSQATNLGPDAGPRRISNVYVFDLYTRAVDLVSRAFGGPPANGPSETPTISADAGVVAFASRATNLTGHVPLHEWNIFARAGDGPIELVSKGFGGVEPDGPSTQPAISADGRYVVFTSTADDLIPGDTNAAADVFVADLLTGRIVRVSVSSHGAQANGNSYDPSISANGQLVSFTSSATNLVPGYHHSRIAQVYVHNMVTHTTKLVSTSSRGKPQNASVPAPFAQVSHLSGDGSRIVFDSNATNLAHVVAGHTNVFEHSLSSGHTTLLSASSTGQAGDDDSFYPATSGNGSNTAFESFADNLANPWAPSENVFVRDATNSTTLNVDVTPTGGPRGPEVDAELLQQAAISPNGELVAFVSGADNLVPDDYNGIDNLYVRSIEPPRTLVLQDPPSSTSQPRPRIELGATSPLAKIGLCVLDGHRFACPVGRPFSLPRVRRGNHVLHAYAAAPGTLYDPVGVTVHFTET